MGDPTLVYSGTTITLMGATVTPSLRTFTHQNLFADGVSAHTENMHKGKETFMVTCSLDVATDIDALRTWAKNGYECTFTSDITTKFTTDALGSVTVINASYWLAAVKDGVVVQWAKFTLREV